MRSQTLRAAAWKAGLMVESLQASTQYEDWTGTAALDDNADRFLSDLAREHGAKDTEFVVGWSFYFETGPSVTFVLIDAADYRTALEAVQARAPLRELRTEIAPAEFARYFKRFSIALWRNGFDLSAYNN